MNLFRGLMTNLPRPLSEFLHAVFVPNQFGIEFPDLDLDCIDPRLGGLDGIVECGFGCLGTG